MSAFTHNLCCASQRPTVHATVFFVVGRDTAARWVGTFLSGVHAILLFEALDLLIRVTRYTRLMRTDKRRRRSSSVFVKARPLAYETLSAKLGLKNIASMTVDIKPSP
jgi:hypothetical protein